MTKMPLPFGKIPYFSKEANMVHIAKLQKSYHNSSFLNQSKHLNHQSYPQEHQIAQPILVS